MLAKMLVGAGHDSDDSDDEEERIKNLDEEDKVGGYENPYRGNAKPLPENFFYRGKETKKALKEVDDAIRDGTLVKHTEGEYGDDHDVKKEGVKKMVSRFNMSNGVAVSRKSMAGIPDANLKSRMTMSFKDGRDVRQSLAVGMNVNKFVHRMSRQRQSRAAHSTFGKDFEHLKAKNEEDENESMATGTSRKRVLEGELFVWWLKR